MTLRRRVAFGAAVAGVLATLALGGWLALPSIVRGEVAARAEERGLRCSIADVSVRFGEVVLRGMRVEDHAGRVRARLDAVTLDAGVVDLALGGGDAVRMVEVRGGEVALDASAEREQGTAPETGSRAARTTRPAVSVHAVRASLRDREGELLRAGAVTGALEADGSVELSARDVVVAAGSDAATSIDRVSVVGRAAGIIDRVEAEGVVIAVADDGGGGAGVLARARALRRRGGDAGAAGARGTEAGADSTSSGMAWLGSEFEARVARVTVRRMTPEGPRDVLTDLGAEVQRVEPGVFRTRGTGQPDHGGRLGWDLRVEPEALRAVGAVEVRDVAVAVVEPLLPDALPLHRSEEARLDGELRIEGAGDSLHATGRLAVRDLAVESARIGPEPIRGIALELDGEATFRPQERRLEIARLRVGSGPAHADVEGAVEWAPDHYLFDLRASLPPTGCNDAIAAIPRDLLQEMAAFSLGGTMAGRLVVRIDSRDLDAATLSIRVADGCQFEMVPPLADLSRFEAPFLHRVEEPDGAVFEMTTGPGTDSWTPIAEISPFMLHAALGHEDAGFFRHAGFSTGAIREALVRNLRAGRYVMGASTISMQLVKNVFLRREKTLARKVQEVLLTWWIESAWPKERILELYLNVIEYGPSVYGIRNASRHYFGVEPSELSPAQSAYLASILPSPKSYHSHWEQRALPASWVTRLTRFVRLLGERGRYDATAVDEGVREVEQLRFHRDGEPLPEAPTFAGRTAPLPIAGPADEASAVEWDEALDGELAEDSADEYQ